MACKELPVREAEDAIRSIFGLRNGASLPKVNAATMQTYYRYLARHLTLPFEARYSSDDGKVYPVTVTALVDPQAMPSDNWNGLRCVAHCRNNPGLLPLVDIELEHDNPNFQLLEDYWFWLWNWRESHAHRPAKPR
jgi:hypothetical protein